MPRYGFTRRHPQLTLCPLVRLFAATSCSNDEFVENDDSTQQVVKSEKDLFRFIYDGKEYAEEYEIIDSIMVFKNAEIGDLICSLESNPEVATLNYPDGLVHYFKSNKEFEEYIQSENFINEDIETRLLYPRYLVSLTLRVYQDTDFGGEMLMYTNPIEVPSMKNAYNQRPPLAFKDFNDIISSFQFTSTVLSSQFTPNKSCTKAIVTFYEHEDYVGGNISYLITPDAPNASHNNLKNVKRCPGCKTNMNDRISSFKIVAYAWHEN